MAIMRSSDYNILVSFLVIFMLKIDVRLYFLFHVFFPFFYCHCNL